MTKKTDFLYFDSNACKSGVGVIKNGCGHFGHRTLILAVSQEGINGIN